jgi:hypothetical protein
MMPSALSQISESFIKAVLGTVICALAVSGGISRGAAGAMMGVSLGAVSAAVILYIFYRKNNNEKGVFKKEMAFKKAEAERDQANADRDYNLALQKLYASNSSGTKKKSSSTTIRYPETYKEFCSATGYAGIMTESEYSSHNKVKQKYGTYKKYLKAMYKKYK